MSAGRASLDVSITRNDKTSVLNILGKYEINHYVGISGLICYEEAQNGI